MKPTQSAVVHSPGPEHGLRSFAAADPAIASGRLAFEVRPWLVGMRA